MTETRNRARGFFFFFFFFFKVGGRKEGACARLSLVCLGAASSSNQTYPACHTLSGCSDSDQTKRNGGWWFACCCFFGKRGAGGGGHGVGVGVVAGEWGWGQAGEALEEICPGLSLVCLSPTQLSK